MADVIELGEGKYPPDGEAWYVVARDPTGRFYVADSEIGYVKSEQASFYPVSEQEKRITIDRAAKYADKHGVHAVYVVN